MSRKLSEISDIINIVGVLSSTILGSVMIGISIASLNFENLVLGLTLTLVSWIYAEKLTEDNDSRKNENQEKEEVRLEIKLDE